MHANKSRTRLRKRRKIAGVPHSSTITGTGTESDREDAGIAYSRSIKDSIFCSCEVTTVTEVYRTKDEEQTHTLQPSQPPPFDEKEAMLKSLFKWLRMRDWATSYYDTEDGICVHVNPDILKREAAAEEIAEQFPFLKSSWNCKVVDTHPGTCRALSETADSMALGML